jgi:NAD(P)-dependent dehydrogenase (short-subunit alcohol dehydrogenase family)
LKENVALVTAGSRRIGAAIAKFCRVLESNAALLTERSLFLPALPVSRD